MVMRITGSSSGLDIDKLVSDLMKAERMPQTKLKQKKLQLDYQTEMYREVNTKLSALRDTLNDMKYASLMTGMKATSSSGAVTATVNGSTTAGTKTINVTQLASTAKLTSATVPTNTVQGSDLTVPVDIVKGSNDKFILTINGTARVVTLAEGTYNSIDDLKTQVDTAIKNQFGTAAQVQVDTVGNSVKLTPTSYNGVTAQLIVNDYPGQTNPLGFSNGQSYYLNTSLKLSDLQGRLPGFNVPAAGTTGSVVINGATIEYTGDTTLKEFMAKVNSSSANVNMSFDMVSSTFKIESNLTGSAVQVDIQSDSDNLLQSLGFTSSSGAEATGTDAMFYLNGSTTAETSSTNNFSRDGIGYKLNQVTNGDVTITIEQDTDSIVNKVKKFVDAYNDLMDLVNTRLSETRDRTIMPLTDDEKSGLSDSDIALWEQKAKSGLLKDSSILKSIKTDLRSVFSKVFDGLPAGSNTLASIGLTTAAFSGVTSSVNGKITLDENTLRNAIDADPSAVTKLFTTNNGIDSYEGMAVTLYKQVDSFMSQIVKTAGRGTGSNFDSTSSLGKQVVNLNTQILTMDDVLAKKEDLYYKRFNAMDQAIAKSNSQISWLSQQFSN